MHIVKWPLAILLFVGAGFFGAWAMFTGWQYKGATWVAERLVWRGDWLLDGPRVRREKHGITREDQRLEEDDDEEGLD